MPLMLPSVLLHTDLYQLTMAQGYWKLGMQQRQAVFELFFRENPFQGAYAIACGLEDVVELIESFAVTLEDIRYLQSLKTQNGSSLFYPEFLQAMQEIRLTIDLDAMEEGTLVFPKEPLLRVQGPLWQCQLLETALLNIVNFSTLIATKASRVCFAAKGDPIIEFGLRRAQGPNGGLMASRSAFVGGATSTSNTLAGKEFGIDVKGTHAHSWIMAFETERDAFEAYARALPDNCIFLVDTYKTLDGVKHAIDVGKKLKERRHPFIGIRLDSGDMLNLSIAARTLLDEAGFKETKILASSDLDEYEIQRLKTNGAKIDLWGVGTRLVTGGEQAALGGVYKLVSIQDEQGHWHHKHKTSDDPLKQTIPGIHAVKRFTCKKSGEYIKDVIYSIDVVPSLPSLNTIEKNTLENETTEDLLCPIFRKGKRVYTLPSLPNIQKRTGAQLEKFPKKFKELHPTGQYTVELYQG